MSSILISDIISKIKVLQIENDNIELFFNRKNNIIFEDSIFDKYINKNDYDIDTVHNEQINLDFINENLNSFFFIHNFKSDNTFLKSFISCIDKEFIYYGENKMNDEIRKIKLEICDNLDESDFYKLFKQQGKILHKQEIKNHLIQNYDTDYNLNIIDIIIQYFKMNVALIEYTEGNIMVNFTKSICLKDLYPCIMIIKNNDDNSYSSVLEINGNSILNSKYENEYKSIVDTLYKYYKDENPLFYENDLKYFDKNMKLIELRELSEKNNLSILKKSEKTSKMIKKSKKELILDLLQNNILQK